MKELEDLQKDVQIWIESQTQQINQIQASFTSMLEANMKAFDSTLRTISTSIEQTQKAFSEYLKK